MVHGLMSMCLLVLLFPPAQKMEFGPEPILTLNEKSHVVWELWVLELDSVMLMGFGVQLMNLHVVRTGDPIDD